MRCTNAVNSWGTKGGASIGSCTRRREFLGNEGRRGDRIGPAAGVAEVALEAHRAEYELADLNGAADGQRVAQAPATAATPRSRGPAVERDRRRCLLTAAVSNRKADAFIQRVGPQVHNATGFAVD